ncbi:hypothetical protein M0804_012194 [Polistes exclamans]|nr:hypothetical protein M0804_012194 [Polistes exclamans]
MQPMHAKQQCNSSAAVQQQQQPTVVALRCIAVCAGAVAVTAAVVSAWKILRFVSFKMKLSDCGGGSWNRLNLQRPRGYLHLWRIPTRRDRPHSGGGGDSGGGKVVLRELSVDYKQPTNQPVAGMVSMSMHASKHIREKPQDISYTYYFQLVSEVTRKITLKRLIFHFEVE